MLTYALRLAERQLFIFPCLPRSKVPATPHGVLEATSDAEQITRWWRECPDYNIAIRTGARPFVIDIDSLEGEAALRRLEAEHEPLPNSIEVITGKGRHVYFKAPADVRSTCGKLANGIDTRGTNGYVLCPPSRHPSGKRYCWSVDSANALAPVPQWLLDRIAAPSGNGHVTPPEEWRELAKGVAEGARNSTAARLAGYLLRRFVDPCVALELLQSWNTARCAPPLPEAEVEQIVRSIAQRELKRRGSS